MFQIFPNHSGTRRSGTRGLADPIFAGNETEGKGLRKRAEFARMRRNSCGDSPSRCWRAPARCLLLLAALMLLTSIPATGTQTRICCSQFDWSVTTAVDAIAPVAAAA